MDHHPSTEQHMVCPECGEPAVLADRLPHRPDTHLPAGFNPTWVHTDGEPLRPVVGDSGYQPAQPVPERSAEAAQAAEPEHTSTEPGTYEIEVCDDCAQVIANGEINDGTDRGQEVAEAQARVWGADVKNLVLACGGECDTSFSTARCDGCGSTLGGNRHPAAVRTTATAEAAQAAEAAQGPFGSSGPACPGCGQRARRHPYWREEPGLYTVLGVNRDWVHSDGSPLCSMPGVRGYEPARPVPAASAGADAAGKRRLPLPDGEVAGLEEAITFGAGMEERLRHAAIATELSVANLQAAGVTGDTVTALTSAGDTLATAVLAFSSVTQGLRRQLLVRDAYQAAPGAGDRDFLTRE